VRVILGKACDDDVRCDVIPLLVNGLDTDWAPCHAAALSAISVMSRYYYHLDTTTTHITTTIYYYYY